MFSTAIIAALTKDRTTGNPIMFATSSYEPEHMPADFVTAEMYTSGEIIPRYQKNKDAQRARSKAKAEIMTPVWLVNKMLCNLDEDWFGRKDVFNRPGQQDGKTWIPRAEPIEFPKGKTWKEFVNATYIEITCGEAPFIVSRYDPVTGESIPVGARVGYLDRKLRVIGENTTSPEEWLEWAYKAYQATYGYEYQGDNLLLARINLLTTLEEYMLDRWGEKPTAEVLERFADVITWNVFQMDGLKDIIPCTEGAEVPATIKDWTTGEVVMFKSLKSADSGEEKKNGKRKKK